MTDTTAAHDSCAALSALQGDVDKFMMDLLDSAVAVKAEQNLTDNTEAFDYTVSFLSGMYRAMALVARDATLAMMD
jgi:hypothetical protein